MIMSRGHVNVSIPKGLAKEIQMVLGQEELGYRSVADVVLNATRNWLVFVRVSREAGFHALVPPDRDARVRR